MSMTNICPVHAYVLPPNPFCVHTMPTEVVFTTQKGASDATSDAVIVGCVLKRKKPLPGRGHDAFLPENNIFQLVRNEICGIVSNPVIGVLNLSNLYYMPKQGMFMLKLKANQIHARLISLFNPYHHISVFSVVYFWPVQKLPVYNSKLFLHSWQTST